MLQMLACSLGQVSWALQNAKQCPYLDLCIVDSTCSLTTVTQDMSVCSQRPASSPPLLEMITTELSWQSEIEPHSHAFMPDKAPGTSREF